jgi:hypothetical protein
MFQSGTANMALITNADYQNTVTSDLLVSLHRAPGGAALLRW